jgi:hypothetical protein
MEKAATTAQLPAVDADNCCTMRRLARVALLSLVLLAGCEFHVDGLGFSSGPSSQALSDLAINSVTSTPDASVGADLAVAGGSVDLASVDLANAADLASSPDLATPPDLAPSPDMTQVCTLGTASNCGNCGHACPGSDDTTTERVCSSADITGTCDIVCRGDSYDVNGILDDGCEALDESAHDSFANSSSVTLEDVVNVPGKNPVNLHGDIFGDGRRHDASPTFRPNGRDDYWRLTAIGAGDPKAMLIACLGITDLPADNLYEVCMSDEGTPQFVNSGCSTVAGKAQSVCVGPPNPTGGDGPYYVRVRKLAGTNTLPGYWLWMNH